MSGLANVSQGWLVKATQVINSGAGANAVDAFMDAAKGRGHRIVFGHDISYLPEIFGKFGMKGVGQYFVHLFKDLMSIDGIPLPFAYEIQQALGLSTKQAINWLCLNIGDIVAGIFSTWHTIRLRKMLKEGNFSKGKVTIHFIATGLKIFCSLAKPSPIALACGIIDLAMFAYYGYPVGRDMVSNFLFPESLPKKFTRIVATKAATIFAFMFEILHQLKKLLQQGMTFVAHLMLSCKRSQI